jgi:hypothetical protein
MNLIQALHVYDVKSPKLRIGNTNDGGYILNELIVNNTKRLVSVGMGMEDTFERDWFFRFDKQTKIEAYDGTYPCQTLCTQFHEHVNKNIFYVKQNVGFGENQIPLNVLIEDKKNTLLKVDVEGAEYQLFDNVDLSNVTGLLLEVHDLYIKDYQSKLIEMISTKFSDLLLYHVHGNSWGSTFDLLLSNSDSNKGISVKEFPIVMELSFINKKLVQEFELDRSSFPIPELDYSNRPDASDIDLYWINAV